jgi:FkbM family methyltransferase
MFQSFKWTQVGEDRIALLKLYEPLQPYLLLELTEAVSADTFIDVGANIGAYSVLMSSLKCINSIHAFEPSPRTSDELAANLALNEYSHKVQIHKTALSDTERTAKFGIVSNYSGANSIVDTSIHATDKFAAEVLVECAPLDSMLTYRARTISLKIDVEGHEKAVLAGGRKLLTENRGIMQIENYSPDDQGLSEILSGYGYRPIFHVGPDHYFANLAHELSDRNIIRIFEKAAEHLIKANFEPVIRRNPTLKLPGGITVEISGALAGVARRLKKALTR